MASGNEAIYSGFSPYNYLAAQSPTDKQAPTSPQPLLGNPRNSDPVEEEEEDKQPYNYLNPYAPAPFQRDGSFRPKEYSGNRGDRDLEVGGQRDVNPALNPTFDDPDMTMSSGGAQFYPARREHVDYSNTYQSNNGAPGAREKPYTIPEQDYSLTDGKIPRPQVGPNTGSKYENKTYNSGFDDPAHKARPIGGDSYLDGHYKRDSDGSNKVLKICGILLLVILCLGIGFAGGWFASKYLNEDDSSSSGEYTMFCVFFPVFFCSCTI